MAKKTAQFNMQAELEIGAGVVADEAIIASMLQGLDGDDTGSDEIIEASDDIEGVDDLLGAMLEMEAAVPPAAEDDAPVIDINDSDAIEAAVAELEKAENIQALYEESDKEVEAQPEADKPLTTAEKSKKGKKEPKEPRVTYVGHRPSEVLSYKLGDKKSELLLLEVGDVELDPAALEAKQTELLENIDKLAKKVAEKSVMLFGWLKNGGELNEVMKRAFQVLAKDGELTSGDKGNLQLNLREKYSLGTARSQANQMFMLFPALAITMKEKGRMVPNPNSLIFMKAKAELGL